MSGGDKATAALYARGVGESGFVRSCSGAAMNDTSLPRISDPPVTADIQFQSLPQFARWTGVTVSTVLQSGRELEAEG